MPLMLGTVYGFFSFAWSDDNNVTCEASSATHNSIIRTLWNNPQEHQEHKTGGFRIIDLVSDQLFSQRQVSVCADVLYSIISHVISSCINIREMFFLIFHGKSHVEFFFEKVVKSHENRLNMTYRVIS